MLCVLGALGGEKCGLTADALVPLWQSLEIINITDPPMAESLII